MTILIDGLPSEAKEGESLVDVIGRIGIELPHVCDHPRLGPIRTGQEGHTCPHLITLLKQEAFYGI
jgi:predicted molibdopterin-dependent oxidoreductase YjgC